MASRIAGIPLLLSPFPKKGPFLFLHASLILTGLLFLEGEAGGYHGHKLDIT